MIKTITKIGNSQGIIFDATLLDMAKLKVGDQVNVTVHEGGAVILTPIPPQLSSEETNSVIRKTVKDYRKTLKRLA